MGIHKDNCSKKIYFICENCNKIICHDLNDISEQQISLIDFKNKCNGWVDYFKNNKRYDFCSNECKNTYLEGINNKTKEVLDEEFRCEEFDNMKNHTNFGIYHLVQKYGVEKVLLEKNININKIRNPKLALLMKETLDSIIELENYLEKVMSKQ